MKKTLNIAFIILAAFAARADYLYWQITPTETESIYDYWSDALVKTADGTTLQMASATDGSTGVSWVKLDGYETQSFFIELVNYDEASSSITTVGTSSTYTYAQLSDYIVTSSAFPLPSISAAWMPTINPAPEPTSAMLLLLGLAGLALRRKRGLVGFARRANRGVRGAPALPMSFVFCLLSSALFAAQNDTLIVFSTPGPDTYRDGTTVLDGESYALVWTANGSTFGGLTGDGKCVSTNDRLVAVAPIAENSCCPETVFEIDAELAKSFQGGTFALYLLDTRVRNATGAVALADFVNGFPKVVNAYADAASCSGEGGKLVAASALSLAEVGVLSEIAAPVITSIQLKGAKIEIKTKNLSAAADYYVVGGADVNLRKVIKAERTSDDVFTVNADDAKSGFFSIKGARKFE